MGANGKPAATFNAADFYRCWEILSDYHIYKQESRRTGFILIDITICAYKRNEKSFFQDEAIKTIGNDNRIFGIAP